MGLFGDLTHIFTVLLLIPPNILRRYYSRTNRNWGEAYAKFWGLNNVNIVNVLHSKYAIKFILKCTSHGGMYDGHQFGKISITPKQWML